MSNSKENKSLEQSIFHAQVDKQVLHILIELKKAGEQGLNVSYLPRKGVVEVQKRGLGIAEWGRIYLTSKGQAQGELK